MKDDAPTNEQATDSLPGLQTDLREVEPVYDQASDTLKAIAKGHPSASAVTNSKGVTVFFDPDTNEVLGYLIQNFTKYYEDNKLPDGSYDVFVIDADQDPKDERTVVIEVTLLDGEHKGEVLALGCPASELVPGGADPIELLGETGVLAVVDGAPRFQLDR